MTIASSNVDRQYIRAKAAIADVPKAKAVPQSILSQGIALQAGMLTVQEIPVDLIVRSETNRQPELDDDFVESISRGVDSPVLVRAIKATQEHVAALKEEWRRIDSPDVVVGQTIYKLVYGERRWAASKKAGKKTIPAIVRELTETQALEIQVRENEQRKEGPHRAADHRPGQAYPGVRRLKLEISKMKQQREAEKSRQPLFAPPQPGTSTTKVPTVAEVALPGSKSIMKEYEAAKSGAQTLAPKMPTKGYLQREAKQREQEAKAQRDRQHNARIDKEYKSALFSALARKSHVCSRLLTHIIPGLLFELWEQNDIPLEVFAQELLGWPAPPNGSYGYGDIRAHAKKHSRKYSGNLLAALLITIHLPQPEAEQLAKYFGVDPKKLRQKAAAAVKQEDADAKKKAKNQGPRAGVPA
jgi:uncharacterized ParB-like nuclease family protein